MRDLEIITANLKGTCVTRSNQVHGLFRLSRPHKGTENACRPGDAVAEALREMGEQLKAG